MASISPTPGIVVGIDFGMTCTGVAYSMGPEWASPTTIQHWPGKMGYENRNKVDTAVAYDSDTQKPVTWGFLIDDDHLDYLDIQALFKLHLDPGFRDSTTYSRTLEQAHTYFTDYMRYLYHAILDHFDHSYSNWRNIRLEFIFSVPTTWKNAAVIAKIEELIKLAGFGQRSNHVVRISLTEAEAAAVYVLNNKQVSQKGDVFLVCDAGGGTTDVNILKVKEGRYGQTRLEPLDWVEGTIVGSTLIDYKVERMIGERLERIRDRLPVTTEELAKKMTNSSRFETFKCSFGSEVQQHLDLLLPIPGLASGLDFPQAQVEDSRMRITRAELQQMFDEQIDKILQLVDTRIDHVREHFPNEIISYLILSGGFGSSPYLRKRMKARYEFDNHGALHNEKGIRILTAPEPQLVVSHGIVMERIQNLKSDVAVFSERCCRVSYGIVVRQVYDPARHQGEDIVLDPLDKRKWAESQVHWLIRQGEKVSVEHGVKHTFRLKVNVGSEKATWKCKLVMSSLPPRQLPKSLKYEGVRPLCNVEIVFTGSELKPKNWKWYHLRKPYYQADFEVRVMIGSADLQFEVWNEEKRINKPHEEVEVTWLPPA